MLELFLASLAGIALLYAPGFLFFKAIRCSNLVSLCAAPIASCLAYGLLPIIYYDAGITCDLVTVVLLPALAFAIAYAISWWLGRRKPVRVLGLPDATGTWRAPADHRDTPFDWAVLGLYVLCGIIVCTYIFIGSLGAPDAFFSRYDNQTHLNVAQSFIDSGQWSSLHAGRYLASTANQSPYATASGFYPATWHALVALVYLVMGAKVTIASNALVAVLAAIVFPAGMFLVIRTLFPNHRGIIIAGAFATVSFATYPWVFPIKGPTFPNMLGFALMVAFMGVIIDYLEQGLVRAKLPGFIAFCLVSFASLAIAHTNALFSAFVFLAAYGGHYIWRAIGQSPRVARERKAKTRAIAITVYCLLILAFWVFCLNVPVLHSVVTFAHREHNPIWEPFVGLLTLRLTISAVQLAMVPICIAGIYGCVKRRMWWFLFPVIYMCIAYFFSRCAFNPWTMIFVGLWYSLPYRIAECLVIYLMPIAAIGLVDLVKWAANFARNHSKQLPRLSRKPAVAGALVVVLALFLNYAPFGIPAGGDHIMRTSMASVAKWLGEIYANDENSVYGGEEVAFVEKAMEIIPEGALVVNAPNDGSMFAYGVNHMNTYFRGSGIKHQNDAAIVLRTKLDKYARDPEVREVVEYTDAQYVLQLDHGVPYEELIKLRQFYEKNKKAWRGVDRIDDDTPGFTLVLKEGDMRLYKIDR
ncbi:MAG: hypothetical protein Q3963_03925 [Coriobacteriaceae bacterium]|nr:hypothetical protein [Coriobacteriaceae bacterium]